jgi:hypothetical protein
VDDGDDDDDDGGVDDDFDVDVTFALDFFAILLCRLLYSVRIIQ